MRLHDSLPSGNGYKARLLLTQLGIPFQRIEYDITRGRPAPRGFDLGGYPAIRAWIDRVAAQPGHMPISRA